MINNILRGFIYFVVLVLVQVLILNNIHFLRVATPFLYLYFILKMPVGSSRTNVVFFSFLIGLTIDVFSNTPGMHAFACTLAGFIRHSLIQLLTLFDPLFLAIRIAASVVTTTLLICTIEAFNIGSQKSGD